ncbi:MAG: hypothetical protein Q8O72_17275 [Bacteroidales bacterium]|nr:hypothetical protein [Bacteroidales bacterium]
MKIRSLLLLLTVSFLMSSCVSSSKHLQKGDYDSAIDKAVKTLMKKPDKTAEIEVLVKAFNLANNQDNEQIKQLKLTGQPDIFDQVVVLYQHLQYRQEKVERLPDNILKKVGFQHVDYSNAIVESKNKAAEFLNAHATSLMANGNKPDARQAYYEFLKVKEYFPNYDQIDRKINAAAQRGTNNIIFYIKNDSRTMLPQDFESELLKISLKQLNQQWLNFDTWEDENIQYDYSIYLTLRNIQTSPDLVKEVNYKEELKVEDGFDYVLDGHGNVMKDTLGNDIKVPRTKIIVCYITETQMNKSATVGGTLDFYDNRTGQMVRTFPVSSEFAFHYRFATANGDFMALKKETRQIVELRPVPFPTDLQIIFDTNEDLKSKTKNMIADNRKMLEN